MSLPTVSIVTPSTPKRQAIFAHRLNHCVQSQNYGNIIEHLVCLEDLTIGEKRNILCEQAKGKIILCMDSDDFYAEDYVGMAVNRLTMLEADTTGFNKCYFYHLGNKQFYYYSADIKQAYVMGSGMAFWKRVWEGNKFKHIQIGEDTAFCGNAGIINPIPYINSFCATIHADNTSKKRIDLMEDCSKNMGQHEPFIVNARKFFEQ